MSTKRLLVLLMAGIVSGPLGRTAGAHPYTLKTFDRSGRQLRYVDVGKGEAVLLLHGFACDHTDWRYQIPVLLETYRVIAPDLAFFGQSDPGPRPHTSINHANDCLALMDHLHIQKAVVIGHSMGGWIARDMYLQSPERVEAIVEIDNTAIAPNLDQLPGLLGVHRPTGKGYSSPVNDQRMEEYKARKLEMIALFNGGNPKAVYKPSPPGKWCDVPVLVVWTSRGSFSGDDVPDGWVDRNFPSPDAHLAVIRDSGHWAMLEQPDLVNKAILEFLNAIRPCGRTTEMESLFVGSNKQLFAGPWTKDGRDARLVEFMTDVTMTMNEACVTGERLLVVDKPWEGVGNELRSTGCWLSVIEDDGVFRMYYDAMPKFPALWNEPNCRILCYAESNDGIDWRKPNLGLCTWEGSTNNNILLPNDRCGFVAAEYGAMSVFIDPAARSPAEKYKMLIKIKKVQGPAEKELYPDGSFRPFGQHALVSADGVHWNLATRRHVNPGGSDTQFSVFFDDRIGKYVAYTRMKPKSQAQQDYYRELYGHLDPSFVFRSNVQSIGRAVSDDFLHWGEESIVLAPDEIDWANSPPGQTRMDIHGGNVCRYPDTSDVYLAFLNDSYHWKYDMSRTLPEGIGYAVKGKRYVQLPRTMGVQLATSRDGIRWNRTPKRRPFIRVGPDGTFWSKMIFPNNDPIRVGDELWIYFCGLDASLHESYLVSDNGARGRAVLRLDGFISADSAYTGGELTTKPLVFTGSKLQLNVDTGAGGTTRVEIQDEAGAPVQGFTLAEADEINGNYVRVLASWKGNSDVTSLAGRVICLRFVMRDTKLYSFQFISAE